MVPNIEINLLFSHFFSFVLNIRSKMISTIRRPCSFKKSPYYTMRFPYVALAIKPNANEMYMQRK